MNNAKHILNEFFITLGTYDYIGFFTAFFIFILFIVLALILRRRIKRSLFFASLGFIFLFVGPVLAYKVIKNSIFSNDITVSEVKKLYYSDTLLIKGEMSYTGIKKAGHCEVKAYVYKKSDSLVKNLIYELKSYKHGVHKIDKTFTKGDVSAFKIVIEPFTYEGDYNITINAGCYL